MEDDEVLYRPVLDDGTHLGESHRTEGFKASTVYRDEDNSTVDIAEWKPVYLSDDGKEGELDDAASALRVLIGVAATALAAFGIPKVKPRIEKLITERVAPEADKFREAIDRRLGIGDRETDCSSTNMVVSSEELQSNQHDDKESSIQLTEDLRESIFILNQTPSGSQAKRRKCSLNFMEEPL